MFNSRSCAAFAGVTAGGVLLAVPVVALGQVPGVDQVVVGGVNQAAQDVVRAAPPVRLPAPAPPPKPALAAPAHAAGGKRAKSDAGGSGVKAHAAADTGAVGSEADAAQTDTQIADDPASATSEASPETLRSRAFSSRWS